MITKNVNGIAINFINNLSEFNLEKMVNYHKINNDLNIDDIDKIIKILTLLSDTTEEVIENIDISDATSIFKEIMIDTDITLDFINKPFYIQNRQFKVREKTSIKDISLVKKCISKANENLEYIYDVAAILYKEVLPDDNLKIDYSQEHLDEKKDLFKKTMTYDYILYHLNNLTDILSKENNVVG